jgi:hypothetical protein
MADSCVEHPFNIFSAAGFVKRGGVTSGNRQREARRHWPFLVRMAKLAG